MDPIAAGQARFQRGRQQVHAPESDEDADSGAACREHEALDGQLTREPGAARSERDTNGHLAPTRRRSGEHEIGHVGTRDQQQQPDGAEKNQQRALDVTHEAAAQRRQIDPDVPIGLWKVFCQPPGDGGHVRLRLIDGDVSLQPREHVEDPQRPVFRL